MIVISMIVPQGTDPFLSPHGDIKFEVNLDVIYFLWEKSYSNDCKSKQREISKDAPWGH